jgi:hypothetical protein
VHTGGVVEDSGLKAAGFRGGGIMGRSVLVVKAHLMWALQAYNASKFDFDKAIHLVRHPLDAIVSERKRFVAQEIALNSSLSSAPSRRSTKSQGAAAALVAHVSTPTWSQFEGSGNNSWSRWVGPEIREWVLTHKFALAMQDADIPVLVVRYEDMRTQAHTELRRILEFLGESVARFFV